MKKVFTILLLIISAQHLYSQTGFVARTIKKMYFSKDTSKRGSFVLLPALSSAPETGIEIGGAALLSFYTDTVHRNTNVSYIFGYATLTTKGQSRLSLSTNYYTPQNKLHLSAGVSYINYPFDFYGIGNNTLLANADNVDEKRELFKFTAESLLGSDLYAGLVLGAFNYSYYAGNTTGIFNSDPQIQGRTGGPGVYAGPSVTFDNRNNNTYTTKGLIVNAYLNIMQGVLGNNNYEGGFFNIEYSQFFLLAPKWVLGLDIQEQSLVGGLSPFYLLPQLGSDEMMRGYYGGRYRDRNFIAGQTELRYRVSKKFGLVGFLGSGEVAHEAFSLPALKPDYGGGIRYFFDIQKGLSVRIDYGVGEKPAGEKRESGFYIGLGQAF